MYWYTVDRTYPAFLNQNGNSKHTHLFDISYTRENWMIYRLPIPFPFPVCKLSFFLSLVVFCRSNLLTWKRAGKEWQRSQIIRPREGLALYTSFNILCLFITLKKESNKLNADEKLWSWVESSFREPCRKFKGNQNWHNFSTVYISKIFPELSFGHRINYLSEKP